MGFLSSSLGNKNTSEKRVLFNLHSHNEITVTNVSSKTAFCPFHLILHHFCLPYLNWERVLWVLFSGTGIVYARSVTPSSSSFSAEPVEHTFLGRDGKQDGDWKLYREDDDNNDADTAIKIFTPWLSQPDFIQVIYIFQIKMMHLNKCTNHTY